MFKTRIIIESKSQMFSPTVTIKTEGKPVRVAGDYRQLNSKTLPDRYPLPVLANSTLKLRIYKCFSKTNLIRVFHNIAIHAFDVNFTLWFFRIIVYPLSLGIDHGQNLGRSIFCFCFTLNDILIFSNFFEHHLKHNCASDINFLGHFITSKWFMPTKERIEQFLEVKRPKTVGTLRRILGTFNFYHRFNKNTTTVLAPLSELLKKWLACRKDPTIIRWDAKLLKTFEKAKDLFFNYVSLHYPRAHSTVYYVTADASNLVVGQFLNIMETVERVNHWDFFTEIGQTITKLIDTLDHELYALNTRQLNILNICLKVVSRI